MNYNYALESQEKKVFPTLAVTNGQLQKSEKSLTFVADLLFRLLS